VNPLRTPAGQQAKAILAGLIALLSALVPVLDDGVTSAELLGVVVAGLIAYGAVFELPNGRAPSGDAGHVNAGAGVLLLVIAGGVVLGMLLLRALDNVL
jgi:hypothetical protein